MPFRPEDGSSSPIKIILLKHPEVFEHLGTIQGFLQLDSKRLLPYYTPDDVLHGIMRGELQVWFLGSNTLVELMVITRVEEYTPGKILYLHYLAGSNLPLYIDPFLEEIERVCRENGVRKIQAWARKGWLRVMKGRDYLPTQTLFSKEL